MIRDKHDPNHSKYSVLSILLPGFTNTCPGNGQQRQLLLSDLPQLRMGPHSFMDKFFQNVQSCTSASEPAQWEASWT